MEQSDHDFREIERDREIDTESGQWTDPELWDHNEDEEEPCPTAPPVT